MFKTGLCSVTFRQLTVEEIIELCKASKIEAIEWGGDVHVPPGDLKRVEEVARQTKDANLLSTSYGSYYRLGEYEKNTHAFAEILATAKSLEVRSIRVWAGKYGSEAADDAYRQGVIDETREIATLAGQQGIIINLEYHGGTLTDTKESAARLLAEIDHPHVKAYWQPAVGETVENRLATIDALKPWLSDVHVFYWDITKRLPLAEGKDAWSVYLKQLQSASQERILYLEFVQEDKVEQFIEDARTLQEWIKEISDREER